MLRSLGRWRRAALLDVGPLRRHRDFRLLFIARTVAYFGSRFSSVAIPFQIYSMTGSTLAVGLVGVGQLAAMLVFAFVGGTLADSRDRRVIVLASEMSLAVVTLVLVANAAAHIRSCGFCTWRVPRHQPLRRYSGHQWMRCGRGS